MAVTHSIRNTLLYANFTELLPIKVLHCGNTEFRVFVAKNSGKYINFLFAPQN